MKWRRLVPFLLIILPRPLDRPLISDLFHPKDGMQLVLIVVIVSGL